MNSLKKLIMESEPKPLITPEEFDIEMNRIFFKYLDDTEGAHRAMDRLMCDVLESLGYEYGVGIFRVCSKWYS